MDFFIKKGATLPILKMELINDGRNDYDAFYDRLQNSVIKFCMTDINTGIKRIGGKDAICILKTPSQDCTGEEYYIGYQFSEKETRKVGTYRAEFTITFNDDSGKLIVPIREDLIIHILDK